MTVLFDTRTYAGTVGRKSFGFGPDALAMTFWARFEPWTGEAEAGAVPPPAPDEITVSPAPYIDAGGYWILPDGSIPHYWAPGDATGIGLFPNIVLPNGGNATATIVRMRDALPVNGIGYYVSAGLLYPGGTVQTTPRAIVGLTSSPGVGGSGVRLVSWSEDHSDVSSIFDAPPPEPVNVVDGFFLRVVCAHTTGSGIDFTVEVYADDSANMVPVGEPVYSRTAHVFDDAPSHLASDVAGDPSPYLFFYSEAEYVTPIDSELRPTVGGNPGGLVDYWMVETIDPPSQVGTMNVGPGLRGAVLLGS